VVAHPGVSNWQVQQARDALELRFGRDWHTGRGELRETRRPSGIRARGARPSRASRGPKHEYDMKTATGNPLHVLLHVLVHAHLSWFDRSIPLHVMMIDASPANKASGP
jgi:hypothetical protein